MDGYGNQGRGRTFSSGQGIGREMICNSSQGRGRGRGVTLRNIHTRIHPAMVLNKDDVVATIYGLHQELYSTREREGLLLRTLEMKVQELEKKEVKETCLLRELEECKKSKNELAKATESVNVLVVNFWRELEAQKEAEGGLLKDLLALKQQGLKLQHDLNVKKQREEERFRDLESKFKTTERELLTKIELQVKKEEKLLEDLQLEKERRLELEQSEGKLALTRAAKEGELSQELDSRKRTEVELLKELDARKMIEAELLRNMDAVTKELNAKKKKEVELQKELDARRMIEVDLLRNMDAVTKELNANKEEEELQKEVDMRKKVEEALHLERTSIQNKWKIERDGWLLERKGWWTRCCQADKDIDNLKKEKDQVEQHLQQELKKQEASLVCKDSIVMTLQALLTQKEEEERKWELTLVDHTSTLTINLKEFQELLHNPHKENPQNLRPICSNNLLEGRISYQVITPRGPDETQDSAQAKPQRKLHLATITLIQEINALKSTLNELATTWKQKHLELETMMQLRTAEKKNYLFEVCKELDHYAVPMLKMLHSVQREEQPIRVQEAGQSKQCRVLQVSEKSPLGSKSTTKGKAIVTTTASKRKLPINLTREDHHQKRKAV